MITVSQLWQSKHSNDLVKIIDINNKIVAAQSLISGQALFFTVFDLEQSYRLVTTTPEPASARTRFI